MPAPIVWALLGLGALVVSCQGEEEPQPQKSEKPKADPPRCEGNALPLKIGGENFELCHQDAAKDGIFQPSHDKLTLLQENQATSYQSSAEWRQLRQKLGFPEMGGLALGPWRSGREWLFAPSETWSLEAEKLYSNAVDFCRERGISLAEAQGLAAKIRPAPGQASLSPKEKAYALMTASLLLSLRGPKQSFSEAHPDFIKTAIEKIHAGGLRLRDLSQSGQKGDFLNRALYSIADNTLLVSEASLDLFLTKDRATILHELYHFFQDIQGQPLSLVEGEVQAYLIESEYALGEKNLLRKGASPEEFEAFLDKEISGSKAGSHWPILPAMRSTFHRAQGEEKKAEAWLKTCRDDAEVTKTRGGLFEIMKGPAGPGHPGSVTSRFLAENSDRLREPGADVIWDTKIKELKDTKKREIQKLKALPRSSAEQVLLRHYFNVLKASLDVALMERLKQMQNGQKSQDNFMAQAAEEIAALQVNRRLFMPLNGVE